ncbi:MAG TPA: aldolase/citrate lyase family protein [Thermomicrobiales bacterium]|nr:aldolase/citrate lyase family protein [Thermomicrobiales bacterium]
MKANTAKAKMLAGKPAYGYSLGLGSPIAAEMLAGTGIDFAFVDTQHGSWGPDSVTLAFIAIAAGGAVPMARVARNDYTLIGRLLDEGSMGIIVPLVHTPDDARRAADACRLPPTGSRSWGWGAANRHGADYASRIDDELFVAVQIESIQAVENAEAIMATPGVDGCWLGPADLALSMGIHPSNAANDDRHARAIERVLEACVNTGKIPGFAAFSPPDALRRAEQGFRYLTAGSDSGFLMGGARAGVQTLGLRES